jgi:hypothetical protein
METSRCGKSILNTTMQQKVKIREYTLGMITIVLLTYVIAILVWVNDPTMTSYFLARNAYGLSADNGPPVPKAFLVYGNEKYEMTPFVHFDGKYMNKIIYPSADVTPVLTVQEGGKIGINFSEKPLSVKAYIADYEADTPSLHALKELPDKNFELSGVQGLWNIEVHAIFSNNNDVGSTIDNKSTTNPNANAGNRYASFELGVDMMPKPFTKSTKEIGQNACAINEIGIAKVSSPQGQLATNDKTSNVTNNVLTIGSINGSSSYIIDLGQEKPICSLALKFTNGEKVVNHFNIQTSTDGIHFSKPVHYDNTASVSGEESYDISSDFPIMTRYAKITFDGNTQGNVYAPLQVRVLGNN